MESSDWVRGGIVQSQEGGGWSGHDHNKRTSRKLNLECQRGRGNINFSMNPQPTTVEPTRDEMCVCVYSFREERLGREEGRERGGRGEKEREREREKERAREREREREREGREIEGENYLIPTRIEEEL